MPSKIRIVTPQGGGGASGYLNLHGGGTMSLSNDIAWDAGGRSFTGTLDPTTPGPGGRFTGDYSGSPYPTVFTGNVTLPGGEVIPARFGPASYGQIRAGIEAGLLSPTGTSFRVPTRGLPTGRGVFKLDVYSAQLLVAMTAQVRQILDEEAANMEEEARTISPEETGSYKSGLSFSVGLTEGSVGSRGGRRTGPSLKITGTVERGEGIRDPRVYSMFIEFGSVTIPAYAVLRRTIDWGAPRILHRLQTEVAARAVRAPLVEFIPASI
jgi:hypothetical protein